MYHYAQIRNGVVINELDTPNPIDASDMIARAPGAPAVGGWRYANGTFSAPELAPLDRRMSRLAFARRFTVLEEAALDLASIDKPDAPDEVRMQKATLRAMRSRQSQAAFIDLDDADTQAGVQALAPLGLLTSARAAAILGAPVQPDERP